MGLMMDGDSRLLLWFEKVKRIGVRNTRKDLSRNGKHEELLCKLPPDIP